MNDATQAPRQELVTLDLEGVLVPEVWIAVAEATGIAGLTRTTRDEPDYDTLMRYRLDLLDDNGVTADQVFGVLGKLEPLPGARAFLDDLRRTYQVVILSDTFEQFAAAMMPSLGMPTVLCHSLLVDGNRITGYQLRQRDQKRHAVSAFQRLNYWVASAGDSYNDTTMLEQADAGFLFRAPDNVIIEFPQFSAFDDYTDLRSAIDAAAMRQRSPSHG